MSYESWRISFQSSEQAARAAYNMFEGERNDAERYRWLRKEHASDGPSYHVRRPSNCPAPHDLDADLDAAMIRPSAGISMGAE